jgi:tRNA pseudouridine38/39 synthase
VFDPAKYSTRLVPFKLAYLGKRYNGFEYHAGTVTPLPTIEEELWKALNKARLIFPPNVNPMAPGGPNWEGMDYSKCGRTDKGVSAFGQVISLRVRSNRPLGKKEMKAVVGEEEEDLMGVGEDYSNMFPEDGVEGQGYDTLPRVNGVELASPPLNPAWEKYDEKAGQPFNNDEMDYDEALDFDPVNDEIEYCQILNRLLPPDIRILAWCPSPPLDFSARFSCRERQYRYYFTQPAFSPTPHHLEHSSDNAEKVKDGWLDIEAMREAAKLFEGLHDFRNFCKIDGGKQIFNFMRRIYHADIEEVEEETTMAMEHIKGVDLQPTSNAKMDGKPKVYTFTLHGSAFLWHQVRHMVAILFLVGQNLERPSLVSELLDVEKNPCRPVYEMATDTPLVLWDCIFPREDDPERKDAVQWHYIGDGPRSGDAKYGTAGIMDDLWALRRERKIDELLASSLMNVVGKQGAQPAQLEMGDGQRGSKSQKLFDGGDAPKLQGAYMPVMRKMRMDSVETINEKYAVKKGFEDSEDMKAQGFRRPKGWKAEDEEKREKSIAERQATFAAEAAEAAEAAKAASG